MTRKSDVRPLRIGIDARCLNVPHIRGMGKYVLRMLEHMPETPAVEWHLFGDRPELPLVSPERGGRFVTDRFNVPGYRFHAWEQVGLPVKGLTRGLSLFHATATTLPALQTIPTVVTIHDTIPWDEEMTGYDRWYWSRLLPSALRRSRAVITISESSRNDIVRLWPDVGPRVHVIPHGVQDIYLTPGVPRRPQPLAAALSDRPYLLYIGGSQPRKRFDWAVDVLRAQPHGSLLLAAMGFTPAQAAEAAGGLPTEVKDRVVFLPFIDETDMPDVYQNKLDLLDETQRADLVAALVREFPEAKIFEVSAREGTGCEAWFEAVLAAEMNTGRFLEID